MAKLEKRVLDLRSADDVIEEILRLRQNGYQKCGNWSLGQICDHLSKTMNGGMDGFGFRVPWILRATIFKYLFGRMVKRRKMPGGAPTIARLKPTIETEDASDQSEASNEAIEECIATLKKAAAFDQVLEDYPFLNHLDAATWKELMWIHASHHLGYLVPLEGKD